MAERLRLKYPLIAEGKYDKQKLSEIVLSPIITTDGFSIFNNTEKKALLARLAVNGGFIVLTDSDSAGLFIRSHIKPLLRGAKIINVYAPRKTGREKRKSCDSKEGVLGVEGIDTATLRGLLEPYALDSDENSDFCPVTKTDFYRDGLSGREGAENKRALLAKKLGLPPGLSANALLEAVNLLCGLEKYKQLILETDKDDR